MKYVLVFLIFVQSIVFAQAPSNDNCNNALSLGTLPIATSSVYSNKDATVSFPLITKYDCFTYQHPLRDVWFSFVANEASLSVKINGTDDKNGLIQPCFVILEGNCMDGFKTLTCAKSDRFSKEVFQSIENLIIGQQYFIAVSDYAPDGAVNSGTFSISITEGIKEYYLGKDKSTTAVYGVLYDSGGNNSSYQPNEKNTFTICSKEVNEYIDFEFDYFNIDTNLDKLTAYDGETTSSPILITLTGIDYGGGGVRVPISSTNKCMTIELKTDSKDEFEGFKAHWAIREVKDKKKAKIKLNLADDFLEVIKALGYGHYNDPAVTDYTKYPKKYYATFETENAEYLGLSKGIIIATGKIDTLNDGTIKVFDDIEIANKDKVFLPLVADVSGDKKYSNDFLITLTGLCSPATIGEGGMKYIFWSDQYYKNIDKNQSDIFGAFLRKDFSKNAPLSILSTIKGKPIGIQNINNINNWQFYRPNGNYLNCIFKEKGGLIVDSLGLNKAGFMTLENKFNALGYENTFGIARRKAEGHSMLFIGPAEFEKSPMVSVNKNVGIVHFYEDCNDYWDTVYYSLPRVNVDTLIYFPKHEIASVNTATFNDDFIMLLPDTLVFLPGQSVIKVPIKIIADNAKEDLETIVISLENICLGAEQTMTSLYLWIHDNSYLDKNQDTVVYCKGSIGAQLNVKGAKSYLWSGGSFSNPNINNPLVKVDKSKWVYVMGIKDSCVVKDSIYIVLNTERPIASVSNGTPCKNEEITLNVLPNSIQVLWQTIDGRGISLSNTIKDIPIQENETYLVRMKTDNDCLFWDTLKVNINNPSIKLLPSTLLLCDKQEITIKYEIKGKGEIKWTTSGLDLLSQYKDSIKVKFQNEGWIKATYFSSNLCKSTDSIFIKKANLNDCEEVSTDFELPSIFLPDGSSNENAIFKYYAKNKKPNIQAVEIFNRWGSLVYSSIDFETGWNGNASDGTACPSDVYICRVQYLDEKKVLQTRVQDITLLR